jgi:predicted metalloprotease with PDZ domain
MAFAFSRTLVFSCALLVAAAGAAQTPPQPLPFPADIAAPRDVPYPGTLKLEVDATDITRRIFNVRQTIPVTGGTRVTLLYPEWLPGNHAPRGRVDSVAGLIIRAGGARLDWTRDPADVYAFHVNVPAGAAALDIEFQFLTPIEGNQGRIVVTQEMMNLQWQAVALYPAGHFTRQIPIEASVKMPEGWRVATALETASTAANVTTFRTTTFEELIDSPIFAGKHFKMLELGQTGGAPVRLNIVADRAELLETKREHEQAYRDLVVQTYKLFGSHHYKHYDFLLALTDRMGGIGLEHHQSSENSLAPTAFTEWDKNAEDRDLLPHEYVHSWNGKFRRPADLWTPNYSVPMRDSLLWVYEGQTQYWGYVLAARSGLMSKEQVLDSFALVAAAFDARIGRQWKPLQDTTNDPITAMRRPMPWRSWQRSEDYYSEGQLIWFDADTLIRELSKGRKSLDDFAKDFFGINDGSHVPATYTFEDVVAALNAVQPYDWAKFLRDRLDGYGPGAPLDGFARSGYRLVYSDEPSDFVKAAETRNSSLGLSYSLGMSIGREGRLTDVLWEGLAFKQGLTPGTQIIAINNVAYTNDRMKDAIKAAQKDGPLELLVKNGDNFRTVRFAYREGLRYPKLERIKGTPDRFEQILNARK